VERCYYHHRDDVIKVNVFPQKDVKERPCKDAREIGKCQQTRKDPAYDTQVVCDMENGYRSAARLCEATHRAVEALKPFRITLTLETKEEGK
jgi:hypothetical protein